MVVPRWRWHDPWCPTENRPVSRNCSSSRTASASTVGAFNDPSLQSKIIKMVLNSRTNPLCIIISPDLTCSFTQHYVVSSTTLRVYLSALMSLDITRWNMRRTHPECVWNRPRENHQILPDSPLPACSWGLCRCSWFRSWCLVSGCSAGSTGSRSPVSSTWLWGFCPRSLLLYSTRRALSRQTQKHMTVASTTSKGHWLTFFNPYRLEEIVVCIWGHIRDIF